MILCTNLSCIEFWKSVSTLRVVSQYPDLKLVLDEYACKIENLLNVNIVRRGLLDFFIYSQMDLLQEFYETTLDALKDAKNDRLWFKTNTKVCLIFKTFHIMSLIPSTISYFFVFFLCNPKTYVAYNFYRDSEVDTCVI